MAVANKSSCRDPTQPRGKEQNVRGDSSSISSLKVTNQLSRKPQETPQLEYKLSVALCDVNPNLGDQGIGGRELRNRERRHCELTDAQHPTPEL
jgi:hypothetical protein